MSKVSIIMPVYNAEKYLCEAIESVLKQTYTDFELLLINDMSTDDSKQICIEYAKTDCRIILLENDSESHGPGPTRNIGLDHATGEYIYFMDADDWIDDCLLQCAIHRMKETEADIVEFGVAYELSNGQNTGKYCWNGKRILLKNEIKEDFIHFWKESPQNLWNCLFRRETVKNIKFESIFNGEDVCYLMDALSMAEKIAYIEDVFYHYRYLDGSTCHRWVESTIEYLGMQWNHQCRFIGSLLENMDPLPYAGIAYGNYMWAIYQLSSSFCPLSFREKRKKLLKLKEIMEFDRYRSIYPFELEHGLIRVKFMLVKYRLEGLILLLGPLYYRVVKRMKDVAHGKE
ncbi:glycosyltransferase family 2 protein [Bariatricus sp. HCP28S3_A7]|uniref:glycosyltransferase family 2 protein n=1 Tax=Bariatricus sp. HCP28S3_A7 TaxID=3438894 RepID=UPI003F8B709B